MLQKTNKNILIDHNINSFLLCGDPGCDGYNTEAVAIFEEILNEQADFLLLLGDLVPIGISKYFKQFEELVNSSAASKVFCLPGNHDIKEYSDFIGIKDYYIKAPNALIIMLDNSKRSFSAESIEFLKTTLANNDSDSIFICFHIPPRNPYVNNKIPDIEWNKIKSVLSSYKNKVRFIFTGHVHSLIDYKLDDYRIIITGGSGSKLDIIDNFQPQYNYHAVKMFYQKNEWSIKKINIEFSTDELQDEVLKKNLLKSFDGENNAFRKYLLFSEQAKAEGLFGIAKLFKAISSSECAHSKNMFIALNKIRNTLGNLNEAIKGEKNEVEKLYPQCLEYSQKMKYNKAINSYYLALEAEKIHYILFTEALSSLEAGKDIPEYKYNICKRCGYTNIGEKIPSICPVCGTDKFKFIEI